MKDNSVIANTSPVGFQSRKAAQICAFFAVKENGVIEKLKLMKLVYLSERRFLQETNFPMLFDEFFSLKHGPICSAVLNGVNSNIDENIWSEFLAGNGNQVVAMKKFSRDTLDELSDAEIENLEEIWKAFGKKTSSQLRNYTHDNCKEYTEVTSGRISISYKEVFEALGIADAENLDSEIKSYRRTTALLS